MLRAGGTVLAQGDAAVPANGSVNLAAEYEISKSVSVFGRINNVGNEEYSEVFGFPALGRTAYAGFKVRF